MVYSTRGYRPILIRICVDDGAVLSSSVGDDNVDGGGGVSDSVHDSVRHDGPKLHFFRFKSFLISPMF